MNAGLPLPPARQATAGPGTPPSPGHHATPAAMPPRQITREIVMTRMYLNDVQQAALFASRLQPSDAPAGDAVAEAISWAVRQFGARGCAARMAQEFGDHPEIAVDRMRWIRQLAGGMLFRPVTDGLFLAA
jgi:hypothetical protein